jgi:hypothetical protein
VVFDHEGVSQIEGDPSATGARRPSRARAALEAS